MIDTDTVREEEDEYGGIRSEGILRCLHQAKIAVTFLEVQFFVSVNLKYGTTKSQLRQKITVNYPIFFENVLNPRTVSVGRLV